MRGWKSNSGGGMKYLLCFLTCVLVILAEACSPAATPTVQTSIGAAPTLPAAPTQAGPAQATAAPTQAAPAPTTGVAATAEPTTPAGGTVLTVTSSAFNAGASIPKKYTCDGASVSPPLQWSGAPANTQSYALIVEDPDAPSGTFIHWVDYDIPAAQTELAEGAQVGQQGLNGARKPGYTGPCPPSGTHRYIFNLYALDVPKLGVTTPATRDQVQQAMQGHILAQGQLLGRYAR